MKCFQSVSQSVTTTLLKQGKTKNRLWRILVIPGDFFQHDDKKDFSRPATASGRLDDLINRLITALDASGRAAALLYIATTALGVARARACLYLRYSLSILPTLAMQFLAPPRPSAVSVVSPRDRPPRLCTCKTTAQGVLLTGAACRQRTRHGESAVTGEPRSR